MFLFNTLLSVIFHKRLDKLEKNIPYTDVKDEVFCVQSSVIS